MALINCKECDKQVSNEAFKCPHCGAQLRKPKRGLFGVIFKYTFILFNIFMVWAMFTGMSGVSEMPEATSSAEEAGRNIGTGLGIGFMLVIWALGDVILGLLVLFTRPKS